MDTDKVDHEPLAAGERNEHSALYCLGALLDEVQNLVKLCGEEIEGGEDAAVGPQVVPWRGTTSAQLRV
jgi:hypothetical protein